MEFSGSFSVKGFASSFLFIVLSVVFSGCESTVEYVVQDVPVAKEGTKDVVLSVRGDSFMPYETRAVENLADYCDYINFVVYKDGVEEERAVQHKGDSGFGQASFQLTPGTHKVLVLAHRCNLGNPAITNPADIAFTDETRYEDTFFYYDDIVVGEQENSHSLTLARASSKVMFHLLDAKPANLGSCEITYSGGTGHLNGTTGYGTSTLTTQKKNVGLSSYTTLPDLNIYTFLPGDEGMLDITVTFKTTGGDVIRTRQFTNVPVAHHKMTVVEGRFFTEESAFTIKAETDWEEYNHISF